MNGQVEMCVDPCSDGCCNLLDLINHELGLYDASRSDHEAGLHADTTVARIANIIEYGDPNGPEPT